MNQAHKPKACSPVSGAVLVVHGTIVLLNIQKSGPIEPPKIISIKNKIPKNK
jgi:hypothetical protein